MPHIHRSVDSAWENRGYDTGANCQNNNIVGVAPVFWAREVVSDISPGLKKIILKKHIYMHARVVKSYDESCYDKPCANVIEEGYLNTSFEYQARSPTGVFICTLIIV